MYTPANAADDLADSILVDAQIARQHIKNMLRDFEELKFHIDEPQELRLEMIFSLRAILEELDHEKIVFCLNQIIPEASEE